MGNGVKADKVSSGSRGLKVDLNKIFQMESSGNHKAYNASKQARGLGQITPIVLKEWNNMNPTATYGPNDLFDAPTNARISGWYMNQRIPQMLKAYKLDDTVENRLAAYNAGIGTVKGGGPLPAETVNYIQKYKEQP